MEFIIDNREKKIIDKISKNDDIPYKLELHIQNKRKYIYTQF